MYVGVQASHRDANVPFETIDIDTGATGKATADWFPYLVRAYGYWAATDQIALSVEYLYERLERDPENSGVTASSSKATRTECLCWSPSFTLRGSRRD